MERNFKIFLTIIVSIAIIVFQIQLSLLTSGWKKHLSGQHQVTIEYRTDRSLVERLNILEDNQKILSNDILNVEGHLIELGSLYRYIEFDSGLDSLIAKSKKKE